MESDYIVRSKRYASRAVIRLRGVSPRTWIGKFLMPHQASWRRENFVQLVPFGTTFCSVPTRAGGSAAYSRESAACVHRAHTETLPDRTTLLPSLRGRLLDTKKSNSV